jgi:hypothetical protein
MRFIKSAALLLWITAARSIPLLRSRHQPFPRQPPPDPGTNGTFQIIEGEYNLADVTVPDLSKSVEMLAVVVGPQGAPGQSPLVLFLHGNHGTCYTPNPSNPSQADQQAVSEWPCAQGRVALPSYRGYLQTQRLLATQGYITVSISINSISAQAPADEGSGGPNFSGHLARSILVRLHLSKWADWNIDSNRLSAPTIVQSLPKADLSNVLLVGHSRGGEGVNRATVDSWSPPPSFLDHPSLAGIVPRWSIRGLFLIGPTSMGHNPHPDVPSVVLLPGCDGDVYKLEGQTYIDGSRDTGHGLALHSSIFIEYANHEWFNEQWVFVPDVRNPYCRQAGGNPNLLSADTQRTIGATYVATAARLFLTLRDDTVRPYLDGSPVSPPTSVGVAHIHTHAIGANRLPLIIPSNTTSVTSGGARICDIIPGPGNSNGCAGSSPHSLQFQDIQPEPNRHMVVFTWTSAGATGVARHTATHNINQSTHISLRIIVLSGTTGTQVRVTLLDTNGAHFTLGEVSLTGMPPSAPAAYAEWAQEVRFSLSGAASAGINLEQVVGVEFQSISTSGSIWILDAWGWRPGTPDPQTTSLPRVDLGEITVAVSPSDQIRVLTIPVTNSGDSSGKIRIFVKDPTSNPVVATSRIVDITSGVTSIDVNVTTKGGVVTEYIVAAKAIQGTLVGDVVGAIKVQ